MWTKVGYKGFEKKLDKSCQRNCEQKLWTRFMKINSNTSLEQKFSTRVLTKVVNKNGAQKVWAKVLKKSWEQRLWIKAKNKSCVQKMWIKIVIKIC